MLVPEPRLKYFIACELARQESGGKGIFIGVYSGTIIVKDPFPVMLPALAFVACFTMHAPRENVSFKIKFPDGQTLEDKAEMIATRPGDTHTLATQFIPCGIQKPGEITAEYTLADGTVEVGRVQVLAQEDYERRRWP